jgi:NAD(P)-dependent dehydrogenase (short-subunit alcohol dehydrogenase family)
MTRVFVTYYCIYYDDDYCIQLKTKFIIFEKRNSLLSLYFNKYKSTFNRPKMTTNPFTLATKTILVTGASSGIGRAIAIACNQMGAHVVITGRNVVELKRTSTFFIENSHSIIVADLNNSDQIDSLINSLPQLDGVVSNAGINKRMLSQYIKANEMDLIIQTNLTSPILLIKKLLKSKKLSDKSSIVFSSSIAAFHSSIGDGVYSATKGGITSFSRVLAIELASKRIRVNTIQPGMIRTEMIEKGPLSADDYAKDEQRYPLGRYGNAEEVAWTAVYLLSDATAWMTGTNLVLDGGISLT